MKEQILEKIRQYDTIIIHRHVRPDPDALGSQCGLGVMLQDSFPDKRVYMVGADEETLSYMRVMDQIDDRTYEEALVIVCDTANQERVCDQRYKTGAYVIKIDHHPNEDPYGDMLWVETSASSCSEMIYELYLHGKESGLRMGIEAARLIFAGIVGDTGRFIYPSTSAKTLRYASELTEMGVSFPTLYEEMYRTSPRLAKLNGYILQNFEMNEQGAAFVKITRDVLRKFDVKPSEASGVVSILGNIEGLKAWVLFLEEEDSIRVRLRSKGIVINTLAMKYNGGGHPLASGATVYSWDEADRVVAELTALCEGY
ncbi:bifunctional oligoribonuclease/PAP phosphatase NrnA [Ectobacillus antri]|jgi:phosphoesterase RecJ-like protein|uniref:Bifunctional oligoribonuclease/PAP phosphatase NrnA n=1 Tax=Ectobacillus antri TaxID=2486280 RepID=A0ABT6H462_9BACI|nr:bifunctional oligoribonuclease/PAP phosphatase NrnA [Ectobacillus antri]MDG4656523.1 bifunctional oligoribonuclease/PAP phosphatase NrnA [Ectobacillus antri]MDG5753573.1 bifunctional oligoribonuclease/PAP phosphatase NrnA [Ectobacillus antri]